MSAISNEMNYSLKPSAIKCSRTARSFQAIGNNSTTGFACGTDTISFYLSAGNPRTFMDGKTAVLKYTLAANITTSANIAVGGHAIIFDYGGWSPINRIDIYAGSGQLLESISSYSVLQNMLHDVFYSQNDMIGLSSQLGTNESLVADATVQICNQTRRGSVNFTNLTAVNGTATTQYGTVCIPLTAGIFNLCDKYFPVYAVNSDIRVDIILNTQASACVVPTVANVTSVNSILIQNPEIQVDYITVEDDLAMQQIASSYGGDQIVIQTQSFHNYQTSIPSGTTNSAQFILPSKVMSARYYLGVFRQLAISNVATGFTNSAFSNPFRTANSEFGLSLGGVLVPQRPIKTQVSSDVSQYFASLQNCYHAMGALVANGQLTKTGYTSTDALLVVGDLPAVRAFQVGIPMDTLKQNSSVMLSGVNLSGITSYINCNFALATTGLYTLDSFINHDLLLVVNPDGSLVSKY
jgi:hypothetical protein